MPETLITDPDVIGPPIAITMEQCLAQIAEAERLDAMLKELVLPGDQILVQAMVYGNPVVPPMSETGGVRPILVTVW